MQTPLETPLVQVPALPQLMCERAVLPQLGLAGLGLAGLGCLRSRGEAGPCPAAHRVQRLHPRPEATDEPV